MRIALFGNPYQSGKSSLLERLFTLLRHHDAELLVCSDFLKYLHHGLHLNPPVTATIESNNFDADVALSLGGDGTFLRTVQRVGKKGIPILGINTGHLGFLADVASNDIEETLTEVLKNYYQIEERIGLQLIAPCLSTDEERFALNEISILKRDSSSMIRVEAYINGEYLTTYRADGLIVATPTGSTAYSLSANGPIILPLSPSFVLTPVAPHSLNVRPLVIDDSARIDLTVESRDSHFLVSLDGRSHTFGSQTRLTLAKSPHTIKVIKRNNHNFFETLRNKLNWGGQFVV